MIGLLDRLLRLPGYLIGVSLMLAITVVLAILLFLVTVYAGIVAVVSYTVTYGQGAEERRTAIESLEISARKLARRWRSS